MANGVPAREKAKGVKASDWKGKTCADWEVMAGDYRLRRKSRNTITELQDCQVFLECGGRGSPNLARLFFGVRRQKEL
jgi:hypothetical protein